MRILYFTNADVLDSEVIPSIIEKGGDFVVTTIEKPTLQDIKSKKIEFIICDRARSLISEDIIRYLPKGVINIHPSFLPWNRGYHPNFWSFYDDTPSGVTIHYVDSGIDTGPIIAQTCISVSEDDTLQSTYSRLRSLAVSLFQSVWPEIKTKKFLGVPQPTNFSQTTKLKKYSEEALSMLPSGWDTPVEVVKLMKKSQRFNS